MQTTEAAELKGLLRACVKWTNDRPHADNDALRVVADWCEEHGRTDEARAIREALGWEAEGSFFGAGYDLDLPNPTDTAEWESFLDVNNWNDGHLGRAMKWVLRSGGAEFGQAVCGTVTLARWGYGSARAMAFFRKGREMSEAIYDTTDDERAPPRGGTAFQFTMTIEGGGLDPGEVPDPNGEGPYPRDYESYPPGALQRVRDLARWDLICHLLGHPPLRLVGED